MRLLLLSCIAIASGCHCDVLPDATCATAVSTTGWRELTSRSGRFSLRLPPTAAERGASCIDSDCGRIGTPTWSLRYDVAAVGSVSTVPSIPGASDVHTCSLVAAGRPITVLLARDTARVAFWGAIEGRDSSHIGSWVAMAIVPETRGHEGVYFELRTERPDDRDVFLAALPSVRLTR